MNRSERPATGRTSNRAGLPWTIVIPRSTPGGTTLLSLPPAQQPRRPVHSHYPHQSESPQRQKVLVCGHYVTGYGIMGSPEYDVIPGIVFNDPEPRSDLGVTLLLDAEPPRALRHSHQHTGRTSIYRQCEDAKVRSRRSVSRSHQGPRPNSEGQGEGFHYSGTTRRGRSNGEKA